VSDKSTGRMLLSHNFDIHNNELPPLTRKEFAQIFIDGMPARANLTCRLIDNPHWVVEVIFPTNDFSPEQVGKMCGDVLRERRSSESNSEKTPDILILGGKKATPATSDSPTSLQTGEWGVDVVETAIASSFLEAIQWEEKTSSKSIDRVFKIELLGNQ
jgi:Protein of unknown function (DUF2656)